MNIRWFIIICFFFPAVLASCDLFDNGNDTFFSDKKGGVDLMDIDLQFSRMSIERGMKTAFLHYIAREGVLIRPEEKPIVGADAIEFLSEVDDKGYKVSWQPEKAEVSADGSMGYTYGTYRVEIDGSAITGGYTNIWKKQNGEWRFVVNATNEGSEEK